MKEKRTGARSRRRTSDKGWQRRLAAMSDREINEAARADPDAQPTDLEFWKNAQVILPARKHPITLRIDKDVLAWFKAQGQRYQSRMNAVLRSYMQARRKAG